MILVAFAWGVEITDTELTRCVVCLDALPACESALTASYDETRAEEQRVRDLELIRATDAASAEEVQRGLLASLERVTADHERQARRVGRLRAQRNVLGAVAGGLVLGAVAAIAVAL